MSRSRAIALRWMSAVVIGRGPEQGCCGVGAQAAVGAAGVQVTELDVEPVQGAGPLGHDVVAAFGEQPQDGGVVFGLDLVEASVVLGDGGDGGRIDRIGLAAIT